MWLFHLQGIQGPSGSPGDKGIAGEPVRTCSSFSYMSLLLLLHLYTFPRFDISHLSLSPSLSVFCNIFIPSSENFIRFLSGTKHQHSSLCPAPLAPKPGGSLWDIFECLLKIYLPVLNVSSTAAKELSHSSHICSVVAKKKDRSLRMKQRIYRSVKLLNLQGNKCLCYCRNECSLYFKRFAVLLVALFYEQRQGTARGLVCMQADFLSKKNIDH